MKGHKSERSCNIKKYRGSSRLTGKVTKFLLRALVAARTSKRVWRSLERAALKRQIVNFAQFGSDE